MAWFHSDRSSAARWFWRVLSCLLRWTTTFVRALGGYIPALGWGKDHRTTRVGPERSETPYPVWWFRHVLSFLRLWMSTFLEKYLPIPWRKKHGSNMTEPEASKKLKAEGRESFPQESQQYSDSETDQEDHHKAVPVETSAALEGQSGNGSKGEENGWEKQESRQFSSAETEQKGHLKAVPVKTSAALEGQSGNWSKGEGNGWDKQESRQFSSAETDQKGHLKAVPVKTSAALLTQPSNKKPGWSNVEGNGCNNQVRCRVETTDEYYCDYDSTWEMEESKDDPLQCTHWSNAKSYKFRRFENAARDMQNYRHGYPNQILSQPWNSPATDARPNLNFYLGKTPSRPDDLMISDFHNEWYKSYDKLECVHTFIQWLFPLPEPGMNYEATPLTREEIKEFCNNSTAKANLLKSYKLMLDFYGIKLDEKTGKVERASNWRERFSNLNSHTHNNLRITRILKCLGILGFARYQAPLVRFFLEETLINNELQNVRESVLNYFVFAVLNREERKKLIEFAYKNYKHDEFVWCPKSIQEMW
ncbi:uncharacterized protein LOC141796342 isoform X2 [Halichoeres trimaculatus]|uniref:uncharacterized protein LOC141796342 isoform X2 n=1 Tax=Halichoeres trimaculatus TaxID=147232 RepID=UPI003D9F1A8B